MYDDDIRRSRQIQRLFRLCISTLKHEGAMSFMNGAGANILRGVAGAGVLAGFDKFKELYISWCLA